MKKFLYLIVVTVTLVFTILMIPKWCGKTGYVVDVMMVNPIKAESFITCIGKLEYGNPVQVISDKHCIIEKSYVEDGEYVHEGDKLFTLREVTINNITHNTAPLADFQNIYEALNANNTEMKENYTKTNNTSDMVAPSSGVLTQINESQVIKSNSKICSIVHDDDFQIRANVNEAQIVDVKVGQKVVVSGIGFKGLYAGEVVKIASEAKQVTELTGQETVIEIIIKLEDESSDLKPGFTAKCKIITSEDMQAITIPYESMCSDKNGSEYVYKIDEDGRAKKTYVTTGKEYEFGVEVLTGIMPNDNIIGLNDNVKIVDGMKIN